MKIGFIFFETWNADVLRSRDVRIGLYQELSDEAGNQAGASCLFMSNCHHSQIA